MKDRRLGRLEVLGAWLGVWTPPRGAAVPPVPWRALAVLGAVLAAVLVVGAVLLVPSIVGDRERADERAREAAQGRHAQALAEADREQRPRTGSGRADPGAGAAAARRTRARESLLAEAHEAVQADAAIRGAGRVSGLDCEPFPRGSAPRPPVGDLSVRRAVYQCVAVTSRFSQGTEQEGVIGIPFRLVADFARGRFAFCRVVPLSDKDRLTHPLPEACRKDGGA
jgi:hypothetical protein